MLTIESGEANVERVEEELKHMIDDKWQWNVKRISSHEYLATFPNKQILDVFSRSNGVTFARHNIVAKLSHSAMDPAASSVLQTGWVQIYDIPSRASNVDAVTLIAELAGEVVAVDEVSLIKEGPARVKLRARNINNIRGIIEVFIDGVGYDFKFIPEQSKGQAQPKGPPPPPKRRQEDSEEEGDNSPDADWKRSRRGKDSGGNKEGGNSSSRSEFSAGGTKQCPDMNVKNSASHKEVSRGEEAEVDENAQSPTGQNRHQGRNSISRSSTFQAEKGELEGGQLVVEATPISMHDPVTKKTTLLADYKHNSSTWTPHTHLLVHTEEGSKMMERSKWPNLEGQKERKEKEHDVATDLLCSQESLGLGDTEMPGDEETEDQAASEEEIGGESTETVKDPEAWPKSTGFKLGRVKRKFYPTVAARKSSRGSQALTPNAVPPRGVACPAEGERASKVGRIQQPSTGLAARVHTRA
ncbi:unnamed protein product [Urochloa humidicola]